MKDVQMSNFPKRNHDIVVANFFGLGKNLEVWQLGWQPENKREAKSSVSMKIFKTYVEDGHFNMIFYYVEDGNFYGIHSENCPIPVFRFKKETGKYIYDQLGDQDTHDYDDGEVLYMISENESVWETVKIGDKSLEEVLQRSYIVNIS
jgi:hypothetical protein